MEFFIRPQPGDPQRFHRLVNPRFGLHVYNWYLDPGPGTTDSLLNVLANWDELVADLLTQPHHFASALTHFSVSFITRREPFAFGASEEIGWHSPVMNWDEFKDEQEVWDQLYKNHSVEESDPAAIQVERVAVAVTLRPENREDAKTVRERRERKAAAIADAKRVIVGRRPGEPLFESSDVEDEEDEKGDVPDEGAYSPNRKPLHPYNPVRPEDDPDDFAFEGAGLGLDRDRERAEAAQSLAALQRQLGFGHYDQKQIERSRPRQTLEWYERQSRGVGSDRGGTLYPVRNVSNYRCLEYCFAIYKKERELLEAVWRARELKIEGKADEVRAGGLDARGLKALHRWREMWGPKSEMSRVAEKLARRALGDEFVFLDGQPRQLEDIVRYHNRLRTRIQVFQWTPDGRFCPRIRRSWDMDGAEQLPRNSPLLSVLYTPPPAEEKVHPVGHFDVIPYHANLAYQYLGLNRRSQFCAVCYQGYWDANKHQCEGRCKRCGQYDCPAADETYNAKSEECADCLMPFKGPECLANHRRLLPSRTAVPVLQTIDQALAEEEVPLQFRAEPGRGAYQQPERPLRSMCDTRMKCDQCHQFVDRHVLVPPQPGARDQRHIEVAHICGYAVCRHCRRYTEKGHSCYVQVVDWKEPGEPDRYVCMDSECNPRDYDPQGAHQPYLIRVSIGLGTRPQPGQEYPGRLGGYTEEGEFVGCTPKGNYTADGKKVWWWFKGPDSARQFVNWCLEKRRRDKKGFTVLAFNGSGYDYPVLYPHIVNCDDEEAKRTVKTIYRGTQLMGLMFGRGEQAIYFRDLMLHTSGSLGSLVKTFGLKAELEACRLALQKEHFPHFLYKAAENMETYTGPLPPKDCYPKPHYPEQQKKFDEWYADEAKKYHPHTEKKWSFWEQAKEYNHHDVELLRRAAREFRYQSMLTTAPSEARVQEGCDPLQYLTTPAACMAVFTKLDVRENEMPNFPPQLNALWRRAMHGGRTEATQFMWPLPDTPPTERLWKFDINSLYPAVEVAYRYPVGYPTEYFGQPAPDRWPEHVRSVQAVEDYDHQQLLDYLLHEDAFSWLVVDVTCPDDLFSPVLPELSRDKKLVFTLRPKHQYAVFSPLLRLACQEGYKVTKIWGAAAWPEEAMKPLEHGIYKSYVLRYMKEKDEASGWPKDVRTEEEKKAYLQRYAEWPLNFGQRLDPAKIEENPGRKATAKLRLNNLWGKQTQKDIHDETKIFYPEQVEEFHNFLQNRNYKVMRWIPLPGDMVEVVYRREFRQPSGERKEMEEEPDDEQDRLRAELEQDERPTGSVHCVVPGALVPMYGQIKMYTYLKLVGQQRCYMDTDSLLYRYDHKNPLHKHIGGTDCGPFLGQFKDEYEDDEIKEYASGGPKNYVVIPKNHPEKASSTVKGIKKGKLSPVFQAAFLRASVISHGLGEKDKAPQAHTVEFVRFHRNRDRQSVQTLDAVRTYRLVNDKLELFPDGSSLPFGHRDVAARRQYFAQPDVREYWRRQRDLEVKRCDALRDEQDRWAGKPVGSWRSAARKRDQPELLWEQDMKDEKDALDELDEKHVADEAKKRARYDREGPRYRRAERKEQAFEDEEQEADWDMAHEPHPDPALFDGMLD